MYEMTVTLDSEENFADAFVESFGMREFKTSGTKFTINGITTFMRGEGNSAVFPLTGYPYMTKAEWLDFSPRRKHSESTSSASILDTSRGRQI